MESNDLLLGFTSCRSNPVRFHYWQSTFAALAETTELICAGVPPVIGRGVNPTERKYLAGHPLESTSSNALESIQTDDI